MNLYYTSSKNEHDFKKCITILKPSEKEKAWDNRGIYRSSFFVENGIYYIITVVLDIQKGQTALRVLDSHMSIGEKHSWLRCIKSLDVINIQV